MSQQLDEVLEELGLSQYLDAFVDQGFDTWETILDITESDMDALGVKLGHRRKLQRRIANYRGIAPDVALVSPTRIVDDTQRSEAAPKQDPSNYNIDSRGAVPGVLAKRKYRRHPKPDESAPERPPSAYVLFSNKMREELKGKSLSFTEIAKLVGENWQALSPAEREPFESQAQMAKDKYNHDLAEYKKTPEYKKYMIYLQEFKAKHSNQTQDKDAFKRIKLADFGSSSQSPIGGRSVSPPAPTHRPNRSERSRRSIGNGSRSGSESPHEADLAHLHNMRKRRMGSTVSASDSHYSEAPLTPAMNPSPSYHHASEPQSRRSPPSRPSSLSPHQAPRRDGGGNDHDHDHDHDNSNGTNGTNGNNIHGGNSLVSLPSLSDMFDNRQLSPTGPLPPKPNTASVSGGASPQTTPHGMVTSSSNTGGGGGSAPSFGNSEYPRTPVDGSLPIHALLSGKTMPPTSPRTSSVQPQLQPHHATSSSHVTNSPKRSPPQPVWSYAPGPSDQQTSYKDHGVSTILRPNSGAPYQFRS